MKLGWVAAVVAATCLTLASAQPQQQQNVHDIIKNEPELSEFYSIVQKTGEMVRMLMMWRAKTVFAPTNEAIHRYNKEITENVLLYHLSNMHVPTSNFQQHTYLSSEVEGSLPMWLWVRTYLHEKEYFVNNAKLIKKDIRGSMQNGEQQVLHIIDEVLEPIIAKSSDSSYNNPDAYKFMSNPLAFDLHNFELSDFEHCVHRSPRKHVFTASEGSTYFMPINEGFAKFNRSFIDNKVLDVHVIYNKVLFTRAFGQEEYDSYADVDSVKVQLSLVNETVHAPGSLEPVGYELYVQSNTRLSDFNTLKAGVVVVKILKANIPIKNGVVHIIDRPLVTPELSLRELVEDEKDKRLSELYNVLTNSAMGVLHILDISNPITFFAPSNEAFLRLPPTQRSLLLTSSEAARKLMELHLVPQSLTTQMMSQQERMSVTAFDQVGKLSIRVLDINEHPFKNYTVEGGGTNATVITPNMMAKNGVVHIINRVLGVPFQTMFDKLKNDGELYSSYKLGNYNNWNSQFYSPSIFFTYFVPDNDAWRKAESKWPSEYTRLAAGNQNYHLKHILDRHLVRYSQYDIETLVAQKEIQTTRGTLKIIRQRDNNQEVEYYVEWAGERARIKRPDIRTTNGIMHVIDSVLMTQNDLAFKANTAEVAAMATTAFIFLLVHFLA